MLFGHLSDLHIRDAGDVAALDRQLDRIVERNPAHLAITGDILDRWEPRLLDRVLDALRAHGLLDPHRLTILHGNHDLASSGGHPRERRDLWRLAWRFWDPPPLVRARKRRFYHRILEHAEGVARAAPWSKTVAGGLTVAVLDTVPVQWWPIRVTSRVVTVTHAIGCVRHAQLEWLRQVAPSPAVMLVHHYPLDVPRFAWQPDGMLRRLLDEVQVPMMIPEPDRAAFWPAVRQSGTRLVLCGHVHRARLDWKDGIAVGLNGQSGADWANRTIAFYEIGSDGITAQFEDGT